MDAQDFRSLQEAYMEVVMNELDEGKIGVDDILPSGKTPRRKMKNKASNLEVDARIASGVANSPSWRTSRAIRLGAKEQERSLTQRAKTIRQVEKGTQKEQADLYDIILSHLLDEGYAETQEQAEAIMVNMSEDWRESICDEVLDEKTASPAPRYNIRKGLDAKSRRLRRSSNFYTYGGENQDPDERTISTSKGEGGITKNPKKLRKQQIMGEH